MSATNKHDIFNEARTRAFAIDISPRLPVFGYLHPPVSGRRRQGQLLVVARAVEMTYASAGFANDPHRRRTPEAR
jgi:hypothetical protein